MVELKKNWKLPIKIVRNDTNVYQAEQYLIWIETYIKKIKEQYIVIYLRCKVQY